MPPRPPTVVLVTGAFGFLGRYAARAFAARGHYVVGLGHGEWTAPEAKQWGVSRWIASDVDARALDSLQEPPDIVIHCAGGSLVGRSFEDPHADFLRTVAGTSAVLDYLRRRAPGARLVYPSSAAVYGKADDLPISVEAPHRPVSPYGVHKLGAEALCRSYARHFGLSTAIVRFFSLYGPELRKQLLWDACGKLRAGSGTFAGTGHEVRDWLHVEDAARLLAAAAETASRACPVANGGTGIGTPVADIVTLLAARVAPELEVTFAGAGRMGDPPAYVADISEARAWGWDPSLDWPRGVEAYADWYLSDRGA